MIHYRSEHHTAKEIVFNSSISTHQIHRQLDELVDYLRRAYTHPDGVILLTSTGIVPPDKFTLEPGNNIQIEIEGFGKLVNTVKLV
jgi:2-dehydro-3-deoxy-D-arabinonate dehydratase